MKIIWQLLIIACIFGGVDNDYLAMIITGWPYI